MRRNYGYFKPGSPGLMSEIAGSAPPAINGYAILSGVLPEEWVITTPASPSPLTEYKISVDEGTARLMTNATVTQASFVTALQNEILKNPVISARVTTVVSGTTLILTSRRLGMNLVVNALGAGLTVAKSAGTGLQPLNIPFGRIVARPATATQLKQCYLPALSTDIFLGVSLAVRDAERNAVGQLGKTFYHANEVCDVVTDTQGAGIWVETADEVISVTDSLYVSLVTNDQGKLTKTASANTVPLTGRVKVLEGQVTLFDGMKIMLISFN